MRIGATISGAEQWLLIALAEANAAAVLHSLQLVSGSDERDESLLLAKSQQMAENVISSLALFNQRRASVVALLQQLNDLD